MRPLKLIAFDEEDLAIISTHLQDAVGCVGDVAWLPRERRFVMMLNRFVWETAEGDVAGDGEFERRRAALHFEAVGRVRRRNIRQDRPDGVLNLLALRFVPGDAPAGTVELLFSSGAQIHLDVECIEARLSDLGPAWPTAARPAHPLQDSSEEE